MIKMQPVTAECYACTRSVMLVHCTVLKYGKKRKKNITMMGVLGQIVFVPLTPKNDFRLAFLMDGRAKGGA